MRRNTSRESRVVVLGLLRDRAQYPTAQGFVEFLRSEFATDIHSSDILSSSSSFVDVLRRSLSLQLRFLALLTYAAIRQIVTLLRLPKRETKVVFAAYPGILTGCIISLLPTRLTPGRTVIDGFISLYDTVVADRGLVDASGLTARFLRAVERRAFSAADLVVTDTELNARHYSALFDLPSNRFACAGIPIDERIWRPRSHHHESDRFLVVFFGTFAPLHGVETITDAVSLLRDEPIQFEIIGDGELEESRTEILREQANVHWRREWLQEEELAHRVAAAHLCLGIFGTTKKTQRVWPIKNYCYMASEKALITGATACADRIRETSGRTAFFTVPCGEPVRLAEGILTLASNERRRREMARSARSVFSDHLSRRAVMNRFVDIITDHGRIDLEARPEARSGDA